MSDFFRKISGIDNSHSDNIIHKADSIIDNDGVAPFTTKLGSHIMSLTCKVGDRISWRDVKIGDLYVIIGTNDMVVLTSMAVEFVLTLLLLLNILVSLLHTCSILIKDLVVNTLEI